MLGDFSPLFSQVWGHLFVLPQCFFHVEIQTFHHIDVSFSDIPVAWQELSSKGEKQQGRALLFWLHVLLIWSCARPISALRQKPRSGLLCCESLFSRPSVCWMVTDRSVRGHRQPLWSLVSWNGGNRSPPSGPASSGSPPDRPPSCPASATWKECKLQTVLLVCLLLSVSLPLLLEICRNFQICR